MLKRKHISYINTCDKCDYYKSHKHYCLKSQNYVEREVYYFKSIPDWCELEKVDIKDFYER